MGSSPHINAATERALAAFLADPDQELSGLDVCAVAGARSGSMHAVLARLEGLGWLESHWEQLDAESEGRQPRRYYRLTGIGAKSAQSALAEPRRSALRPRWRPVAGQP